MDEVSKMVEAGKEIRRAVDTGKVSFGTKQCEKELKKGNGEIIVISDNINKSDKEKIKHLAELGGKQVFEFDKNGLALGSVCGKPFVVSALIVLDVGKSKVLELSN
jgi:large subunit ribosomal protein L30e